MVLGAKQGVEQAPQHLLGVLLERGKQTADCHSVSGPSLPLRTCGLQIFPASCSVPLSCESGRLVTPCWSQDSLCEAPGNGWMLQVSFLWQADGFVSMASLFHFPLLLGKQATRGGGILMEGTGGMQMTCRPPPDRRTGKSGVSGWEGRLNKARQQIWAFH